MATKRFSLGLFEVCLFALVILACTLWSGYVRRDEARVNQAAYEVLPNFAKAKVDNLRADFRVAGPGDFVIFNGGRVVEILKVKAISSSSVEVDFRTAHSDYVRRCVLTNWILHRDVNRVVKKNNPRAGELALEFLSQ